MLCRVLLREVAVDSGGLAPRCGQCPPQLTSTPTGIKVWHGGIIGLSTPSHHHHAYRTSINSSDPGSLRMYCDSCLLY